ncbi:AAA family ATPase [Candidatus Woesearchaeota archaeon]|nr:AAA family ATPase [Candidatus Woesearchaeota archaeon]
MKRYILTGGPGAGKSSIILALEKQGEYTIREAAEDCIKLKQAQGIKEPWTEPGFQESILELQQQREARVPKEAARVFIDRGLLDGLAYTKPRTETYKKIAEAAAKTKYDLVFIIEPLETVEKTAVRREDMKEALEIRKKLEETYRQAGYEPILIKAGPLEQRVKKILAHIKE